MSKTSVIGPANLGTSLQSFICTDELQPGAQPSYEMCKVIFEYHPLGAKIARFPIKLALSQAREISITGGPEQDLKEAFEKEWKALEVKKHILNVKTMSRVYGISSVCLMANGIDPMEPLPYDRLAELAISFNILDALNTAGSLVLNQDPNSVDFQKVDGIAIAGTAYHRSRAHVVMHGDPIYISYTPSAYGFTGRSVYQPCLYPLKSFISSMVTDDMVVKKAGLLVVMMQTVSSAVDWIAEKFGSIKRNLLKEAETENVLQVGEKDKVETLNMQNLDGAFGNSRRNILENIASGDDMPAVMLNNETFAHAFSTGSEDAKYVAHYIDDKREEMESLFAWFDLIVMHRAWNKQFYKSLQAKFPEQYGGVDYTTFFYEAKNSFKTKWPNLLTEPDSEKAKKHDFLMRSTLAAAEVIMPACDQPNKATVVEWVQSVINEQKEFFPAELHLEIADIATYEPPTQMTEPGEPKATPYSHADSSDRWPHVVAEIRKLPARP